MNQEAVLTTDNYSGLWVIGKQLKGGCLGVVLSRAGRLIDS